MIYQIKKILNFKIELIFKIQTQNFKIRKKKRKEIIEILIFKMLIHLQNKIHFLNKFKIHRIQELKKEAIDFQIYLLQVIQLKTTIQKKSKNIVMMMILKILWTMTLNHSLKNITIANQKKSNKKIK